MEAPSMRLAEAGGIVAQDLIVQYRTAEPLAEWWLCLPVITGSGCTCGRITA
jgi:hypothetical protein